MASRYRQPCCRVRRGDTRETIHPRVQIAVEPRDRRGDTGEIIHPLAQVAVDQNLVVSATTSDLNVEHADLALLRYLDHSNKTRFAGQPWLGCLLKAEHKLVVGYKTDSNWFFALDDCTGSSTLVWPSECRVVNAQGLWTGCEVPPHVPGFEKRLCFAAVDCDDIMAFTHQWQSPLQLAFDNPTRSMEQLQCNEVAAVSGVNAKPLKVVAA